MGEGQILDLWRGALLTVAMVGAPFVLIALAVGVVMSILQAATQLQENALSFVPKVIVIGMVLALGGNWVLGQLVRFTGQTAETMTRIAEGHGP